MIYTRWCPWWQTVVCDTCRSTMVKSSLALSALVTWWKTVSTRWKQKLNTYENISLCSRYSRIYSGTQNRALRITCISGFHLFQVFICPVIIRYYICSISIYLVHWKPKGRFRFYLHFWSGHYRLRAEIFNSKMADLYWNVILWTCCNWISVAGR